MSALDEARDVAYNEGYNEGWNAAIKEEREAWNHRMALLLILPEAQRLDKIKEWVEEASNET